MSATPLIVLYRSFWNIADVFFMVWGCVCGLDIFVRLFFVTFPFYELSHFSTSMYRQWVPCERNSSNNFILIILKLCTCFRHGLKMCMWFGYNHCINFCYFFHFVNFVIFWHQILWKCIDSGYIVSATLHAILKRSFWNFAHFFHSLEMCLWFGYNPWINFCHYSHFVNFVIFWHRILWKCIDSMHLVSATRPTILKRSFWNFAHIFSMVWRYACGLDIILELILVTISTLWTLSFSNIGFYESV